MLIWQKMRSHALDSVIDNSVKKISSPKINSLALSTIAKNKSRVCTTKVEPQKLSFDQIPLNQPFGPSFELLGTQHRFLPDRVHTIFTTLVTVLGSTSCLTHRPKQHKHSQMVNWDVFQRDFVQPTLRGEAVRFKKNDNLVGWLKKLEKYKVNYFDWSNKKYIKKLTSGACLRNLFSQFCQKTYIKFPKVPKMKLSNKAFSLPLWFSNKNLFLPLDNSFSTEEHPINTIQQYMDFFFKEEESKQALNSLNSKHLFLEMDVSEQGHMIPNMEIRIGKEVFRLKGIVSVGADKMFTGYMLRKDTAYSYGYYMDKYAADQSRRLLDEEVLLDEIEEGVESFRDDKKKLLLAKLSDLDEESEEFKKLLFSAELQGIVNFAQLYIYEKISMN